MFYALERLWSDCPVIPLDPDVSLRRTLVVLRHGRTAWNDAGRAQGHADIELDDLGRAQAAAAAAELAPLSPVPDLVAATCRGRARPLRRSPRRPGSTAEVGPAAAGVRRGQAHRPDLRRSSRPRSPRSTPPGWPGTSRRRRPGAETTADVRARIVPAMRACLDALGPGETGVVVTHGAALRVGVAGLLGWPDEIGETLARDGQLRLAAAARARALRPPAAGVVQTSARPRERPRPRGRRHHEPPARPGDGRRGDRARHPHRSRAGRRDRLDPGHR